MPLDGVRVVPLTAKAPPFFVFLLWRRGDVDPALGHVLATAAKLLPTTARWSCRGAHLQPPRRSPLGRHASPT
jgi:hypothetical protein